MTPSDSPFSPAAFEVEVVEKLLARWLERLLSPDSRAWWEEKRSALASDPQDRALNMAISLVARRVTKDDLVFEAGELEEANRVRSDWDPREWTLDQAVRISFLLAASSGSQRFPEQLDSLFKTADVSELVGFYRGLPLYPQGASFADRAAEGIRSNMKAVFNAVAHRNPFPKEHFSEGPWNQMVLKALFIESPLFEIQGLDQRTNKALCSMLCDYAHERWAAGRKVHIELWRCVGPVADDAALEDLQRVFSSKDLRERQAAALALARCPDPKAKAILDTDNDLAQAVDSGHLSWESLMALSG